MLKRKSQTELKSINDYDENHGQTETECFSEMEGIRQHCKANQLIRSKGTGNKKLSII